MSSEAAASVEALQKENAGLLQLVQTMEEYYRELEVRWARARTRATAIEPLASRCAVCAVPAGPRGSARAIRGR